MPGPDKALEKLCAPLKRKANIARNLANLRKARVAAKAAKVERTSLAMVRACDLAGEPKPPTPKCIEASEKFFDAVDEHTAAVAQHRSAEAGAQRAEQAYEDCIHPPTI